MDGSMKEAEENPLQSVMFYKLADPNRPNTSFIPAEVTFKFVCDLTIHVFMYSAFHHLIASDCLSFSSAPKFFFRQSTFTQALC